MFRVCWALPRTVPTEPVQTPRTPLVESRTSCQQLVRIVKDHQKSVINSHQFMHCLLLISVVMVDVSWWRNSQTKLWLQLLCGAGRTHLHTPYAALALLRAYWQLRGSPCKGCKIDQDWSRLIEIVELVLYCLLCFRYVQSSFIRPGDINHSPEILKGKGPRRMSWDQVFSWADTSQLILIAYFLVNWHVFHMSNRKNPGNSKYVFDGHWFMKNWWKLLKTRGKRWDLPKLAIPLFKVMSSYFSNIHISDTQISHIIHSSSHIYIYNYIYKCSSFLQAMPPKFTIYHYWIGMYFILYSDYTRIFIFVLSVTPISACVCRGSIPVKLMSFSQMISNVFVSFCFQTNLPRFGINWGIVIVSQSCAHATFIYFSCQAGICPIAIHQAIHTPDPITKRELTNSVKKE